VKDPDQRHLEALPAAVAKPLRRRVVKTAPGRRGLSLREPHACVRGLGMTYMQPNAQFSVRRCETGASPQWLELPKEHRQVFVIEWLADRTEPTSNTAGVSTDELYAYYARWCAKRSMQPDVLQVFGDEFDRVRLLPS
jgi:hypothetical protein